MTIASAIQNARNKIATAYQKIESMGGTLPATQDLNNLSNTIENSFPSRIYNWMFSGYTNGDIFLTSYEGGYDNTVVVPRWGDIIQVGNAFANNPDVVSVDLQRVPFRNNSMSNAFNGCRNLVSVSNIPNSVTNMSYTFLFCSNLNQNIQIPNSVTNMFSTFESCTNLNQNIQIPNSVTSMDHTFSSCRSLNQNIQIPNSVTNMFSTFAGCYNLNQNIQIPNSVTSMYGTFYSCYNLNQNIQIPNSVTNMSYTFYSCNNLQGRINVLTTELQYSANTFNGTSLPKDVYIYYTYKNGEYTKTYNLVVADTNTSNKWNALNGVTVYDLGSAPW